jgi:hypothetical protein
MSQLQLLQRLRFKLLDGQVACSLEQSLSFLLVPLLPPKHHQQSQSRHLTLISSLHRLHKHLTLIFSHHNQQITFNKSKTNMSSIQSLKSTSLTMPSQTTRFNSMMTLKTSLTYKSTLTLNQHIKVTLNQTNNLSSPRTLTS